MAELTIDAADIAAKTAGRRLRQREVAEIDRDVGNGAGLPAVAVPNGVGDRGLPTSLAFMGRAWEENAILAAARAYQSVTDWHERHPSLA